MGDQVLITLAAAHERVLREGDTIARMGGDEFVAVLIDLQDPSASVPCWGGCCRLRPGRWWWAS
jgi:GGDEF domain-containing protein